MCINNNHEMREKNETEKHEVKKMKDNYSKIDMNLKTVRAHLIQRQINVERLTPRIFFMILVILKKECIASGKEKQISKRKKNRRNGVQ